MKIATVTCHDVYNYGASLQAYALQEYIKSLGCNYEIIDYKPDYLSNHFKLSFVANPKYDRPFLKQAYLLAKLPGRLKLLKKKKRFDDFRKAYLKLSSKRYESLNQLKQSPPKADIYVAGSDQIWNTLFRNGLDPVFYLDFVTSASHRISFAASFATETIPDTALPFVEQMLKNFNAISVRESSALSILEKMGLQGQIVCDPVFLLSKTDWEKLFPCPVQKDDYILVYDCEQSDELRVIATHLRKVHHIPIYTLSLSASHYADRSFIYSGPIEFLSLIAGARYVVANSFHALAFSLIFHKDFFIAKRSEKINTRMQDLLNYVGLENRLISSPKQLLCGSLQFKDCDNNLSELIENSKRFIKAQISVICQNRG